MNPLNTVYLHLGSNKNEPLKQLLQAYSHLESTVGKIITFSRFYKTAAWGKTNQADFINVAIELQTELKPEALLNHLSAIENKLGRIRLEKWAPRIIDIDIIFYNKEIVNKEALIIPHQEMQNRNFVLEPLNEIASSYIHPVLLKSVKQLHSDCQDQSKVTLL